MIKELGMRAAVALSAVAAMLALAATPVLAGHDGDPTEDEVKCQLEAAKRMAGFARAKVKCLVKCQKELRKGDTSRDCVDDVPIVGDGDPRDSVTQDCIDAATTKAVEKYDAKCTAGDCPECYQGGDCNADGDQKAADVEAAVDLNDGLFGHCDDSASGDGLNADEGKCQDQAASIYAKLAADLSKCTQKCYKDEHKGTPRDCDPDGGADTDADACADAAQAKCESTVASKCPDPAECQGNVVATCGLIRGVVDGFYDDFFCGS
jgi:hypothetical protein